MTMRLMAGLILLSAVGEVWGHHSRSAFDLDNRVAVEGRVVEVFDTGDGVVVGTLPGAREGLAVTVAQAASSG